MSFKVFCSADARLFRFIWSMYPARITVIVLRVLLTGIGGGPRPRQALYPALSKR